MGGQRSKRQLSFQLFCSGDNTKLAKTPPKEKPLVSDEQTPPPTPFPIIGQLEDATGFFRSQLAQTFHNISVKF